MKVYMDCETTGINPKKDEILSLAIVNGSRGVVFSSLFKPVRRKIWPGAERINGIGPETVADERPIAYYKEEIERIIGRADKIYGYNIDFDLEMLANAGICPDLYIDWLKNGGSGKGRAIDVKEWFANSPAGNGRPVSLPQALAALGVKQPGPSHHALWDSRSCLAVAKALEKLEQAENKE